MTKLEKDLKACKAAWAAANGWPAPFSFSRFEKRRVALTPYQVAQLDPQFRRLSQEVARWTPIRDASQREQVNLSSPVDWPALIQRKPSSVHLAMHDANGYVRAYAVQHAPMRDTAAMVALLVRCNDWYHPIGILARRRLAEILADLDQDKLVPLCLFVLSRAMKWQRGGAAAAKDVMKHPAWPSALKLAFMTTSTGPVARTLRNVLREDNFDWALPDLAISARSAFVRAVASDALLNQKTRWIDRFEWEWHDKVFNLNRKVPIWKQRSVLATPSTQSVVLQAACFDKSALVRGLAADHLIKVGPQSNRSLTTVLAQDKSRRVQERMAYYDKKWNGNPSDQERLMK